ncbi:hypothetical protein P4544_04905 [Halomonas sp. LY9]
MIADEPTKGLDAPRRDEVVELLAHTPNRGGALLTITHDIEVARRLGAKSSSCVRARSLNVARRTCCSTIQKRRMPSAY